MTNLGFTNQKNAFIDVQVIPHTEKQSNHNIVHGKINFSVPSPPPYKRKIWDYDQANLENISNDLNMIDWGNAFSNMDIDEMVNHFSEKFMFVITNNIPNKTVTCSDKDAPWITPDVKSAIKRNYRIYRKWVKKGRIANDKDNVRSVQNETNRLIKKAKRDYFNNLGSKLNDSRTGSTTFWTAFKRLVNKKKLANIPPLLENERIISDF